MKVTLLASTPNATKLVATAAWICTHQDFPTEADLHPDKCGPLVKRVIGYGHESILEHASFSFAIEGISRACSHQLVRYRHASFSQQSQRYVKLNSKDSWAVMPESIRQDKSTFPAAEVFHDAIACAERSYELLLARGIPAEDARFVLPNATATKLVITMNARELRLFFAQRLCEKAQWEIRELATEIYLQCKAKEPILFEGSGPDCKNCKEKEPCR
jgi:thymidylate synthase (FAD)